MEQDQKKKTEKIIEIEIERLRPFKNHPFKTENDEQMKQLKESIQTYGILTPLIVRPMMEGFYEIISGHRRRWVAMELGYEKVPVIIRVMNDQEATIAMVDSNFQRNKILPSEKAYAYKMKMDAMKRKPGRYSNRGLTDHKLRGRRTVEIIGEEFGDSSKQVQRYIKLTELSPELLKKLDEGKISFHPAIELAFLSKKEQEMFLEAMNFVQCSPSISQAQRIRKLSQEKSISIEKIKDILGEVKKGEVERVSFKKEQLYRYFPSYYNASMMRREILAILNDWKKDYRDED